ncbi:nucleotidyltransferase domain-containing protein [Franconibacter helveticus 513]|uniref:nucleotidyltransferase domain-containing protein n=1 Tax=Franconibacter helveticus TaxID=357240 RepID=UPI0003FA7904|nr:nucleotidyltransferase domain-containing protein [Franconibacter helveticus]MDU6924458.1 nucleotidyltransferase domain-containing protein [Franconibacter helveticus]
MEHNGVSTAMRERVRQVLKEVEQQYGVKVLYACESGSRGWGFASPDSDYDVRFLYVHPPEWYLRVDAPRDVIELPIDDTLDVCGWEWRKALGLLKRANPTLIEWLDSPIVYQQDETSIGALREQVPLWFSADRARWHYYSMARKNFRGYLQGEQVRLKKYFYVLRPLLAVRWIEAGKGAPPMRFADLLDVTVDDPLLRREIDELLARKQRAGEAEYGLPMPRLHAFIAAELARGETPSELPQSERAQAGILDRLLYQTVMA